MIISRCKIASLAFLVLMFLLNNFCFSQNYNHTSLIYDKEPVFQSIPANFEYNFVRCILKDYKGFMWFGTSDGLIRFDGINLYVYENTPGNNNCISHNTVNAIVEDDKHNLWIGTSNGINKYNREKDNFQGADSINGENNPLNYSYISSLYVGRNSVILVGTLGYGFNIYNYEKSALEHYDFNSKNPKSVSSGRITSIVIDPDKKIWVGTQNGLNLFKENEKEFCRFYYEPEDICSLSDNHILKLTIDHTGTMWIATRLGGINKLVKNNSGYSFKRFTTTTPGNSISSNFVRTLYSDKNGYLWIGTDNGCLNRMNLRTESIEVFPKGEDFGFGTNSISSIYGDNEGRIWIGTSNRGIKVIDDKYKRFGLFQHSIYKTNGLPNNDVKGFAEDRNGNIWIATDGGGVCRFDPVSGKFDKFYPNNKTKKTLASNAAQAIICDSENNIWIGNWGGGVDFLKNDGSGYRNYSIRSQNGAGNNNVVVVYQDYNGNIWAGSSGSGLFLYSKKIDKFIPLTCTNDTSVLSSTSYISSILLDSDNLLWVGTLNGVVTINSVTGDKCQCSGFLPANRNLRFKRYIDEVIFEDSKGRIWFGTNDRGLNLFCKKDSSFTIFLNKDGLPSNSIKGILEDKEGNLWISTNKGISRLNIEKKLFTNFTREDGLNSNEFYARSCIKSQKGEFYFGGENGFNVFFPENIKKNMFIPPVYLTGFKINNKQVVIGAEDSPLKKHISETSELILKYNQSSFTIDFVAVNYTLASKNQYCYKLEGFDKDWNYIGNNRSASYTNIMPGKYVFLVKGSNNDGIWNNKPVKLLIIVNPPFWKTWWAMILYALFFFLILYVSLEIWKERIYIKNQLILEKSARAKEHELNDLNLKFFTNVSHEFRTPLSLIIAPLEKIISTAQSALKEELLIIHRNALRLLQLTNNLMDLRKLEDGMTGLKVVNGDLLSLVKELSTDFKVNFAKRNIDFSIETAENSINGWFDTEKIETIILNLLSNAFKYTLEKGRISIIINTRKSSEIELKYGTVNGLINGNYAEISVCDNGIGILPDELPFIFDKFYRAKSSEIKKNSGTGIGLTLTKGFVELHHGHIFVESKPGIDTRITFIIPIDKFAYSSKEIATDSMIVSKKALSEQLILNGNAIGNSTETQEDFKGEYSELLIVEDNDELRDFLSKELGKEFMVSKADNGRTGIEVAQSNIPDIIVSDVLMPECNGFELCKVLKTDVRTCHIPIILLSAKTTIEEQIEGIETGADAYITKPFSIQFLSAQINQLIKSRKELYNYFKNGIYVLPNKLTEKEINQKFLQNAIEYIVENITDNNLNVEGLANALNLNRSNVYRKIKSLTGLTIIEFIRMVRLKEAIKLMEAKKYSISEIAYRTGFTSPSYFAKSFRAQYGKTPSDFLS